MCLLEAQSCWVGAPPCLQNFGIKQLTVQTLAGFTVQHTILVSDFIHEASAF